jgi:predicted NAD-dependent protein-ADP-ribosyltransferase YbiA (DUF1768 family)
LAGLFELLNTARRASTCIVNTPMSATYWGIGWRIVENQQAGQKHAGYSEMVVRKFSTDLTQRFSRGLGPAQIAVNDQ